MTDLEFIGITATQRVDTSAAVGAEQLGLRIRVRLGDRAQDLSHVGAVRAELLLAAD